MSALVRTRRPKWEHQTTEQTSRKSLRIAPRLRPEHRHYIPSRNWKSTIRHAGAGRRVRHYTQEGFLVLSVRSCRLCGSKTFKRAMRKQLHLFQLECNLTVLMENALQRYRNSWLDLPVRFAGCKYFYKEPHVVDWQEKVYRSAVMHLSRQKIHSMEVTHGLIVVATSTRRMDPRRSWR